MTIYSKYGQLTHSIVVTHQVDRIDNNRGYTLDNIQWLPLWKNIKKDIEGRKNAPRNSKGQFMAN